MGALAGTGVPVPAMHVLCDDPLGHRHDAYVMDYLDGRILTDAGLRLCRPADRKLIWSFSDSLATLHQVDFKAVTAWGFAPPGDYIDASWPASPSSTAPLKPRRFGHGAAYRAAADHGPARPAGRDCPRRLQDGQRDVPRHGTQADRGPGLGALHHRRSPGRPGFQRLSLARHGRGAAPST